LGQLRDDFVTHFAHVLEFLQFGEVESDIKMLFDGHHQSDMVQ
jgi:hypothetical protein